MTALMASHGVAAGAHARAPSPNISLSRAQILRSATSASGNSSRARMVENIGGTTMPCSQLQTALDIAVLHGNASGFNISILPAATPRSWNRPLQSMVLRADHRNRQWLPTAIIPATRSASSWPTAPCGLCCHCSAELRQLLRHCQPSWGPWSVTWTQIHSWSATWTITTRGSPLQETTGAQRSEGPHPALGQSLTLRLRRL